MHAHAIVEFHGVPCGKMALCLECTQHVYVYRADTVKQIRGDTTRLKEAVNYQKIVNC